MPEFFGGHNIPKVYGVCPRCKGQLFADVYECELISGTPTETGFYVFCKQSHDNFDDALDEAIEMKQNRIGYVEKCEWDYDELLKARRAAYSYLKHLRN